VIHCSPNVLNHIDFVHTKYLNLNLASLLQHVIYKLSEQVACVILSIDKIFKGFLECFLKGLILLKVILHNLQESIVEINQVSDQFVFLIRCSDWMLDHNSRWITNPTD